jgi:hypothetical protein
VKKNGQAVGHTACPENLATWAQRLRKTGASIIMAPEADHDDNDAAAGQGRPGGNCLTEFFRTLGGLQALFFGEVLEDVGNEIGAIPVFTVRHFIDFADEPFGEADGDLRHARGARTDFSFLHHFML